MAMAKKQSEYIPQKAHVKVHHTSCHTLYKFVQCVAGGMVDFHMCFLRYVFTLLFSHSHMQP